MFSRRLKDGSGVVVSGGGGVVETVEGSGGGGVGEDGRGYSEGCGDSIYF